MNVRQKEWYTLCIGSTQWLLFTIDQQEVKTRRRETIIVTEKKEVVIRSSPSLIYFSPFPFVLLCILLALLAPAHYDDDEITYTLLSSRSYTL